jgi:YggT family protein
MQPPNARANWAGRERSRRPFRERRWRKVAVVLHPSLAQTITYIISELLQVYFWLVVISAILSWIQPSPYSPIYPVVNFVYAVTEPVFDFVREHVPVVFGGIDLSPMVVIVVIWFLQMWLLPTLGNLLTPSYGLG